MRWKKGCYAIYIKPPDLNGGFPSVRQRVRRPFLAALLVQGLQACAMDRQRMEKEVSMFKNRLKLLGRS